MCNSRLMMYKCPIRLDMYRTSHLQQHKVQGKRREAGLKVSCRRRLACVLPVLVVSGAFVLIFCKVLGLKLTLPRTRRPRTFQFPLSDIFACRCVPCARQEQEGCFRILQPRFDSSCTPSFCFNLVVACC